MSRRLIDALKNNIRETIGEIQLPTIDNVLKNWIDRVGYCMAIQGSHLNEIIFPVVVGKLGLPFTNIDRLTLSAVMREFPSFAI